LIGCRKALSVSGLCTRPLERGRIGPRTRIAAHITVLAAARAAVRRENRIETPDAQHASALI
jgi:hypothetical protein